MMGKPSLNNCLFVVNLLTPEISPENTQKKLDQ